MVHNLECPSVQELVSSLVRRCHLGTSGPLQLAVDQRMPYSFVDALRLFLSKLISREGFVLKSAD